MTVRILVGDCRPAMRMLPARSVHTFVTSIPYWGLRDYKIDPSVWGGDPACAHAWGDTVVLPLPTGDYHAKIERAGRRNLEAQRSHRERGCWCGKCGAWRGAWGLEPTYQLYLQNTVDVFREVMRVMRPDSAGWLNVGDAYANDGKWGGETGGKQSYLDDASRKRNGREKRSTGLKSKDLIGLPWRVAFALQDAGWHLRQDIIWHKPNPMPESVTDRCTKAHEYIFLLAAGPDYFFDAEAIKEPATYDGPNSPDSIKSPYGQGFTRRGRASGNKTHKGVSEYESSDSEEHRTKANLLLISDTVYLTRNKRSVWTVSTKPFPGAHFATFPPDLIEPCIRASTSEAGCCSSCGAQWGRITAEVEAGFTQKMPDGMATHAGAHHGTVHREGREKGAPGNPVIIKETIGFYPACDCVDIPALPRLPRKPGPSAFGDDREAYQAAVAKWREACAPINLERKRLCDAAREVKRSPSVVLDPCGGAGTTGLVADREGRDAILIEINPSYAAMAKERLGGDAGLFGAVTLREAAE